MMSTEKEKRAAKYQADRERLKALSREKYWRKKNERLASDPEFKAREEVREARKAALATMTAVDRSREHYRRRASNPERRAYVSAYVKEQWQKTLEAMTPAQRSEHDAFVKRRAERASMTPEERREDTKRRQREHKRAVYERDAAVIAERGRARRGAMSPEERRLRAVQKNRWQTLWRLDHPEEAREQQALERSKPAHKARHADYEKANLRVRNYGLTDVAVAEIVRIQGGCCPACSKPLPDDLRRAAVDHDHVLYPGRRCRPDGIRGILHIRCNVALGLLGDNAEGLRRALAYLENWERNHVLKAV